MAQTMFDTVLSLPLFQGLSPDDLTRILESTRLRFETLMPETQFVQQDDLCNEVIFILGGTVRCTTTAADRMWNVEEVLPVPTLLGLEVLYGSTRVYPYTAYADTTVRLMRVDKRTLAALTSYFEVFRINVLNTLSALVARQRQLQWMPAPQTLEGRIVHFMRNHVQRPAGYKLFRISLSTLGAYLGEDSRYISRALHRLEKKGLLQMNRRMIHVPAFENIIKETL